HADDHPGDQITGPLVAPEQARPGCLDHRDHRPALQANRMRTILACHAHTKPTPIAARPPFVCQRNGAGASSGMKLAGRVRARAGAARPDGIAARSRTPGAGCAGGPAREGIGAPGKIRTCLPSEAKEYYRSNQIIEWLDRCAAL